MCLQFVWPSRQDFGLFVLRFTVLVRTGHCIQLGSRPADTTCPLLPNIFINYNSETIICS